jgi:hypothetical protein
MRTLATIPHPLMRITINQWNGKYQLRYELDRYEQAFKFSDETEDLASVRVLAESLAEEVLKNFVAMRSQLQNQTSQHNE